MWKIGKVFFVINTFCFGFIFLFEITAFSQQSEPLPAIVIVKNDSLRSQPYKTSVSRTIVSKGTKLRVIASGVAKGWYLAYLEEMPSVVGYIHGNSIKIINLQITEKPKTKFNPKQEITILPKNIILIDESIPDQDERDSKFQVKKEKSKRTASQSNYCQPPIYCPDIDEVQVALFDNSNKFQKGKFEKTIDWEKRKQTILRDIKLSEGHTLADKMYFLSEFETNFGKYSEAEYDADKEQWSVSFDFREMSSETCIPVMSQGSGQILCLLVQKKFESNQKGFVSMPPSVAAINDRKLQIAFVGRIIEPYIWSNKYTTVKDIISGIHFELEDIVCVNPKTGQQWKINMLTNNLNNSRTPIDTKIEINSKVDAALEPFKRILVTDPMNAEAHLGMGKVHLNQGNYELAISSLKTALYWNSNLVDAYIELSRAYYIKSDCQQAEYYIKKAIEMNEQNQKAQSLKKLIENCS